MIEVSLNNKKQSINSDQNLAGALDFWGFDDVNRFAVAVNQTFVPRSDYATHTLCDGDEIDVVQAISGG